jgi:hypothetical protein
MLSFVMESVNISLPNFLNGGSLRLMSALVSILLSICISAIGFGLFFEESSIISSSWLPIPSTDF